MQQNINLLISYDGTPFSGFEIQPNGRTIREEIEKALHKLYKSKIKITAMSRTDAGVHAVAQIANYKANNSIPVEKLPRALNSILPDQIRVQKALKASSKFNSRYSIKAKEYEYLIFNEETLPPFLLNYVWHVKPKINIDLMKKAAKHLIGTHDFKSFCGANSDETDFVRKIFHIKIQKKTISVWDRVKWNVISIKVKGNGFLYKMVRNIVGTLVDIGVGNQKIKDISGILKAKDRKRAGRCAPPQGLCLVRAEGLF